MTSRLALALLALLLVACSSSPVVTTEPWIDIGRMPRLSNELGLAHGCPVGEDVILTSRHVIEPLIFGRRVRLAPRWSADGVEGWAQLQYSDRTSDLVVLKTSKPLRSWYPIAEKGPAVGDEILLVGYDWDRSGFPPKQVVAKVTAVFAGRVIYNDSPGGGSSGCCALNRKQEAIGVHGQGLHGSSLAVAIWGIWNPLGKER